MRLILPFLLIFICCVGAPVFAQWQDGERITGLDVEEHFNNVKALFNVIKLDVDEILEFTDLHIDEDFSSVSTSVLKAREQKVVERELDKAGFLDSLRSGFADVSSTALTFDIKGIRFLGSVYEVEVEYVSHFSGNTVLLNKTAVRTPVGFFTVSSCKEKFRMREGVLLLFDAHCENETTYKEQSRKY